MMVEKCKRNFISNIDMLHNLGAVIQMHPLIIAAHLYENGVIDPQNSTPAQFAIIKTNVKNANLTNMCMSGANNW